MWTKTITITHKGRKYQVVLTLTVDNNGKEAVRIESFANELFMERMIMFTCREDAKDYINLYSEEMAKSFFLKEADNHGVWDN
jgi:hypothetical protein